MWRVGRIDPSEIPPIPGRDSAALRGVLFPGHPDEDRVRLPLFPLRCFPECLMSLPSMLPPPVFDRDAVLDFVDGEFDLLQELVQDFLQELPSQVVQIQNAITEGDAAVVHNVTHQLKSSIGNLGGRAAYEVVQDLELASGKRDFSTADGQFSECRYELTQFCMALSGFLAESPAVS